MSSQNGVTDPTHEPQPAEDTVLRDHTPPEESSDGEGAERSTREKLKKTSIAGLSQATTVKSGVAGDDPAVEPTIIESLPDAPAETENGTRGRPSKKRSFEDLQPEDAGPGTENGGPPLPKKGQHKRMRSREVTAGDDEIQHIEKADEATSPVLEESDIEAHRSPGGPGILVAPPAAGNAGTVPGAVGSASSDTTGATEAKAAASGAELSPSTATTSSSKLPASSGFANASSASPFATVASPKSPDSQTSETKSTTPSAFATSGLSAFASSEKSPFGAAGDTAKTGGFGGGSGLSFASNNSGGFGGPAGPSPFAAKSSTGFGSGGGFGSSSGFGGFGGAKPFGSGLSSFAGPASGAGTFGKPKPFGASGDDNQEGSENGEDGGDTAQNQEEEFHHDSRFVQQEVETGEEDEETIFNARAKLYHFEGEWKERGVGQLKINIRYEYKKAAASSKKADSPSDEDPEAGGATDFQSAERKARLIMRTDAVHKLILNTPVFKDMNVGTPDGKEPTGKTMHLTGLEDGKPRGFQVKIGKEEVLKELYYKIREIQMDL